MSYESIHIVCISNRNTIKNAREFIDRTIAILEKHCVWGKVEMTLYPTMTAADKRDVSKYFTKIKSVERIKDKRALLNTLAAAPNKLVAISIGNVRTRAKDQLYDINWHINWFCRDPLDPKVRRVNWLAPNDAVANICIRCNDRILGLGESARTELCRSLMRLFAEASNAHLGFITCEDLQDTQCTDFYGMGFIEPCRNIRREAMSYWATFPEEEQRVRVPAVFWGNYYSGELLEAVQQKCPAFFKQIADWKAADLILPGPRPWPHVVEKMRSGMFWTLSMDPLHDSRSELGFGTCYGGRMLALNLFARRLLSEAGIHI